MNPESERAAFEANIDKNPLDSTNHLVYADWLQEHGEEDEAAFRRAMGEYFRKYPNIAQHHPEQHFYYDVVNHPLPEGLGDVRPVGSGVRAGNWEMFHGYRDFENGLRQAFMVNRPQKQSRTYSRRRGRYYTHQ